MEFPSAKRAYYPKKKNARKSRHRTLLVVGISLSVFFFYCYTKSPYDHARGDLIIAESSGGSPIPSSSLDVILAEMKELKEKVNMHERRFWLEALEPNWQYRPKYWLGKADDVEDKEQVIPFFLGNFVNASDTKTYARRIYIDIGIKDFDSSICWIMQQYPTKFDLIYGFECQSDLSDVTLMRPSIEKCIQGTTAEQRGYRTEEILNTLKVQYSYVGLVDNPSAKPPTVGLSKFIHDIGVKEDDFVVLKMDVEELEFDLLEQIMKDGTYKLLDEVFVEVHYNHPEMHPWGWANTRHSRNDAQALLNKARDLGMFIHPWP